jgi:zinc-ribbon domain
MKKKLEWKTIKRLTLNDGKFSEIYHLQIAGEDSVWYAYRAQEHDRFLKDLLAIIESVEGSFKRTGLRTTPSASTTPVSEHTLFCTNCGAKGVAGYNYCGKCGTRLPAVMP